MKNEDSVYDIIYIYHDTRKENNFIILLPEVITLAHLVTTYVIIY